MPLDRYREKRKFAERPEPKGRIRRSGQNKIFVVQKHDASHLHYDFRLEIGGIMVSWAVPKGRSFDPWNKRFATMTEDHPIEYAEFEGIIPEGHYGAGTVVVWDGGTYETQGDPLLEQQLAGGELKIELHDKKLRGAFVLIHIGQRSGAPREKSRWLLIKRKDKWADRKWRAEAPEMSRSAINGRTLDEIENARSARKRRRDSNRSSVKLRRRCSWSRTRIQQRYFFRGDRIHF
jgi:bifunctional non-homologous end joining protein LigD